ncbi:large ribosomal RNA subunit accumulation protein YCED homolog 2, chloroplastic-like isoform X1 [Phoenix dactylifera]|uniref:Large ribosomal RNA subunit accumulation protein YCED homolog 2, chloroplastic-like isoform X1 n=2 Tax=Phoenix dactylifera TaxID=42345 RepID=A0A8B9A084_PHODC|nr:large ribosomal RNA subunit accumulation protein YCED homolog 2, chloroplastic-like isoform X1 [Phoenix dactylifera]
MAKSYHSISRLFTPIDNQLGNTRRLSQGLKLPTCTHFEARVAAVSTSKDEIPQNSKKKSCKVSRAPRRLITISTSSSGWNSKWSCDYVFTLAELQLADLAEDGQKNAEVFISLSIQKHTGFGFSIEGRIITAFNRKCGWCFSSYCTEINTTFDVWVLPSSKRSEFQLPEIGGSDPSVIYVNPGSEANIDSLIQDTIRLTASAKDTCSESCERPALIWQYSEGKRSYDQRWSRLLEIKNAI